MQFTLVWCCVCLIEVLFASNQLGYMLLQLGYNQIIWLVYIHSTLESVALDVN